MSYIFEYKDKDDMMNDISANIQTVSNLYKYYKIIYLPYEIK